MDKSYLTPDMLAKAKAAKSAEDLIALAKESGTALKDGQAQQAFERLSASGALADDELEAVAGGTSGIIPRRKKPGSC